MLVFALPFAGAFRHILVFGTFPEAIREIDSLIRLIVCLSLLILGDAVVADRRGASEGYWGMLSSPTDGWASEGYWGMLSSPMDRWGSEGY